VVNATFCRVWHATCSGVGTVSEIWPTPAHPPWNRLVVTPNQSPSLYRFRRFQGTRSIQTSAIQLLCGLAIALPAAHVRAGPVLSNLVGYAVDSTKTDMGPSSATTLALALGFTTGGNFSSWDIESIVMGVSAESAGPRSVSIYESSGSSPAASALATSTASNVPATFGTVSFTFPATVSLTANTTYWVVPQFDENWSWHFSTAPFTPQALGGSNWSYVGTLRQPQPTPSTWQPAGFVNYSVTISAVPEPSTIIAALIGLAGLAWRFRSRSRPSQVHASA